MQNLSQEQFALLFDGPVKKVFAAFPSGTLRFVGGCVRNVLLGAKVEDIDLATQLKPAEVEKALLEAGIKAIPTGREHGTITARLEKTNFEITSLRKDVQTDGRRAVIAYTQDWSEDALRRDFTMNALYVDDKGRLYDPTGEGLDDLEARRLRFIENAQDRVTEDYLRILRFFRFMAYYAQDRPLDKAALEACRLGRSGLKKLSKERIWSELKKLLSAPQPARALRTMLQQDILEALLPSSSNVDGLEAFLRLEARESLSVDPLLRLMSMSLRDGAAMARLAAELKMSNAETGRLVSWGEDITALDPLADERQKLAAIYHGGRQTVLDRCFLRAAGETDPILSSRWMSLADLALGWTPPEFPITGQDLKDLGIETGPEMGRAMKALKALWVRSGFTADKEKLLMILPMITGKSVS